MLDTIHAGEFEMRLLHIADVHLERPFVWLGPGRGRRRRSELREALRRVVDLARKHQVDALCIAGDLYERENATAPVGDFLRETFARLAPTPVLIAPGNHDYFSPGCLYDRVTWPANVHVFREGTPRSVPIADGAVWGLAFTGRERLRSPLADLSAKPDGLAVGLFHAEVVPNGTPSPYAPLDPVEIAVAGLRFAMLGHIHAGGIDTRRGYAYPGSIEPLDTSESGPRWAVLVDASNSGVKVEGIAIAQRRVIAAELDVTEIANRDDLRAAIDARCAEWTSADVRLRVVGTLRGELALDPETIAEVVQESGLDVTLEIVGQPEENIAALENEQSTRGAFVRRVREAIAAATDDATRRMWEDVLAAGLAAFRGQEVVLR